jgi:hypothetical protein
MKDFESWEAIVDDGKSGRLGSEMSFGFGVGGWRRPLWGACLFCAWFAGGYLGRACSWRFGFCTWFWGWANLRLRLFPPRFVWVGIFMGDGCGEIGMLKKEGSDCVANCELPILRA